MPATAWASLRVCFFSAALVLRPSWYSVTVQLAATAFTTAGYRTGTFQETWWRHLRLLAETALPWMRMAEPSSGSVESDCSSVKRTTRLEQGDTGRWGRTGVDGVVAAVLGLAALFRQFKASRLNMLMRVSSMDATYGSRRGRFCPSSSMYLKPRRCGNRPKTVFSTLDFKDGIKDGV